MVASKDSLLEVFSKLSKFVTPMRRARLERAARNRVHSVAVLLENVTNVGNENAVVRTMDGLGFQTLHTLGDPPDDKSFKERVRARTDAGSRKWLTIKHWTKAQELIERLRTDGFIVASTDPLASTSLYDIDVNQKMVIAFGSETTGISEGLRKESDLTFSLPMFGMVESYNVSVAVAITLFHIRTQLSDNLKV